MAWVDPSGLWNLLKWLYTDDGDAPDCVYTPALDQARRSLTAWAGHFARDNGVAVPVGVAALGPIPKALPWAAGVRKLGFAGGRGSWATSGTRLVSIGTKSPAMQGAARFIAKNQGILWLYYEAGVAWFAAFQTLNDPSVWGPDLEL